MMVELAAALLFLLGLAHSVLGERYLLTRLFRRDNLPKLLGSTAFTVGTLRFVWHLTTLAWYGLATLLLLAARDEIDVGSTLRWPYDSIPDSRVEEVRRQARQIIPEFFNL